MIDEILIKDFKAHRETRVPLGRFTMLVGDNASGKTSVLDALALQAALNPNPVEILRGDRSLEDLLRRGATGPIELISSSGREGESWKTAIRMSLLPNDDTVPWRLELKGSLGDSAFTAGAAMNSDGGGNNPGGWNQLGRTVGNARIYRLRADNIAAVAHSNARVPLVEADGRNTAVVLENMKLSNDEVFERVEAALRQLIPSVERIRIQRETMPARDSLGSKVYFDFRGAPRVPAHNASHGTLIVLALLTILHDAGRPDLLLIDDFDHALHPRAQMELVRMLKGLLALDEFKELQIVATTHSPYTLDELDPSEVQAFALNDDGTVVSKRLSDHPEAKKMKGSLRSGQLWSLDPERDWVRGNKAA